MNQKNQEPLAALDARLQRLKAEAVDKTPDPRAGQARSGYGFAFMIATDLVGGVIGGALLGWGIDTWLKTAPWGLITFFFVGAAAGMWNAYRTARGHEVAMGFRPPPTATPTPAPTPGPAEARGRPGTSRPPKGENEGQEREDGGQPAPSIRDPQDHPDPHRRP
jgi:ATP synthase protein I